MPALCWDLRDAKLFKTCLRELLWSPAGERDVFLKNALEGASLVAQWLRICLPMQGTRVRALVWEDPTCRGATKPMSHNY